MYEKIIQDSIGVIFYLLCVSKTGMKVVHVVVDVQHIYQLKMERGTANEILFQPETPVTFIVNYHAAVMLIDPTLEMFVQIYKPFRILLDVCYYMLELISHPIHHRHRHHRRRRLRFHLKMRTRIDIFPFGL